MSTLPTLIKRSLWRLAESQNGFVRNFAWTLIELRRKLEFSVPDADTGRGTKPVLRDGASRLRFSGKEASLAQRGTTTALALISLGSKGDSSSLVIKPLRNDAHGSPKSDNRQGGASSNVGHLVQILDNIPCAVALDTVLRESNADLFAWVEQDAVPEDNLAALCVSAYDHNPGAAAYIGGWTDSGNGRKRCSARFPWGLETGSYSRADCPPGCMIPRNILQSTTFRSYVKRLAVADLIQTAARVGRASTAPGIWFRRPAPLMKSAESSTYISDEWNQTRVGLWDASIVASRQDQEWKELQGVTIAFLAPGIPAYDKSSSDNRIFQLLKLLLQYGANIKLLYSARTRDDFRYRNELGAQVQFTHVAMRAEAYVQKLQETKADMIWITNLFDIGYFRKVAQAVELLRERTPAARIILDTMDYHYKKHFRRYLAYGDVEDRERAEEFKKLESELYPKVASIVFVTDEDGQDAFREIDGIRNVTVIPNVHSLSLGVKGFSERQHLCFLGSFAVDHNRDAVDYFIEEIFAGVLQCNPGIEFHIIGSGAEQFRNRYANENVKTIGYVRDLESVLQQYKVFVCPLTYGTGLKGKIGSAISAGLPVVTTSIGAEGYPVHDGEHCFIADTTDEFAAKCNQLLAYRKIWEYFNERSRRMLEHRLSKEAVGDRLAVLISQLIAAPDRYA